jgi:serine/threonine protein kinase
VGSCASHGYDTHNLTHAIQQLGERLGKGAFGEVFKGLDLTTGQFVAVKRIEKGRVDTKTMMVRDSHSVHKATAEPSSRKKSTSSGPSIIPISSLTSI